MTLASWIFLGLVEAVVLHWPTWLALLLAQAVSLWTTPEMIWLPSALLAVGIVVTVAWSLLP